MWWYLLPVIGGAAQILQAGVNGVLGERVGSPVVAALISFVIGTIVLMAGVAAAPIPIDGRGLATAPWWAWAGGALGAVYVSLITAAAPRTGAGMAAALVLIGQVVVGIVLDNFGFVGFARHPLGLVRCLGVLLIAAGVATVRAS